MRKKERDVGGRGKKSCFLSEFLDRFLRGGNVGGASDGVLHGTMP